MGKVATSPLPSRGSPPLQSGGQDQKWPTCGQSGYITPAVPRIPTASERGAKSEVAHLWAKWLRHPCRLGDPHRFKAGGKSEVAHLWAKWLRHPCRLGDPHRFRAGGKIRSGPQVGKVATPPLPSRGSPPLKSGGGNQKWPTCGQSGYVTPAVSGIPSASEQGAKSEVAHKWAKWLRHPCRLGDPPRCTAGGKSEVAHKWAKWLCHACRLGDPHRLRAGGKIRIGPLVGKVATSPVPSPGSPPLHSRGKIRSGPLVGKVATSPLPSRGSPPLQSGGQNQKWPTSGQSGYVTPAVSGFPTASERGAKSEMAHKWAKWLRHPCRLEDPHRFRAGGKTRIGPLVGKVATSPLPPRGSPPLQSGGQNQKWSTSGQSGYVTPAVSGIPTASQRGAKPELAHLRAKWLRHPCRLGDPHRLRAGGKIRSGPQVGKVAMSPLPSRGSPPLNSGGQNQKWPTCGQSGYATPAVSGIPPASERGGNQKWPTCGQSGYVTPAVSGITHRFRAGGKIRSGPQVGKVAMSRLPSRGSPPLQSRGKMRSGPLVGKWLCHACRLGDPPGFTAGGKSEVAHLWAKWLRHPCRLEDPHRLRAGGKIRSGPLVGKVATSPLPSRGTPPLHSGGQNQKWPTCGQSGYVTPAISGIPTASERGARSEVAHKWAKWLCHPCRLEDPHRFRGGGKTRIGPLVGKVATSRLPSRGSPPLHSRGAKSEVAHKWAKWLCHPCRLGDPHRFTAGGKTRIGPLVGKVATSPLPSRGSPPLNSGGQNQKWPTSGQSGYVTPTVSGIPTA